MIDPAIGAGVAVGEHGHRRPVQVPGTGGGVPLSFTRLATCGCWDTTTVRCGGQPLGQGHADSAHADVRGSWGQRSQQAASAEHRVLDGLVVGQHGAHGLGGAGRGDDALPARCPPGCSLVKNVLGEAT